VAVVGDLHQEQQETASAQAVTEHLSMHHSDRLRLRQEKLPGRKSKTGKSYCETASKEELGQSTSLKSSIAPSPSIDLFS
jgi:hypothetical protein